jgi:hypothetical protein
LVEVFTGAEETELAFEEVLTGAEDAELALVVTFLVELALEEVFTGAEETELAAELALEDAALLTEAVGLLEEVVFLVGG